LAELTFAFVIFVSGGSRGGWGGPGEVVTVTPALVCALEPAGLVAVTRQA
jgi:hypothetical protein